MFCFSFLLVVCTACMNFLNRLFDKHFARQNNRSDHLIQLCACLCGVFKAVLPAVIFASSVYKVHFRSTHMHHIIFSNAYTASMYSCNTVCILQENSPKLREMQQAREEEKKEKYAEAREKIWQLES